MESNPAAHQLGKARFDAVVASLRGEPSVSDCLPYEGAAEVPALLDHLARQHERSDGLAWDDVCPAYALAVITRGRYRLPADEHPMEALWNEVGVESRLLWEQVRDLVTEAWQWLDTLESRGEVS